MIIMIVGVLLLVAVIASVVYDAATRPDLLPRKELPKPQPSPAPEPEKPQPSE